MNSESLSADSHSGIRSITRNHDVFVSVIIFTTFRGFVGIGRYFFQNSVVTESRYYVLCR